MSKCLIAEYETSAAAKIGLEVLEKSGFTLNDASVVSSANDPAAKYLSDINDDTEIHNSNASAPEGRGISLGILAARSQLRLRRAH